MWRDRFSNHSTPNTSSPAESRSSSLPRRSLLLQRGSFAPRPPLDPRASTLSLASATSTADVPTDNTSTSIFGTRIENDDVAPQQDVIKALEKVLGRVIHSPRDSLDTQKADALDDAVSRPVDFVETIDFGGLSLAAYVEEHDNVIGHSSPLGERSVEEYENQRDKFEDLHKSIIDCDAILKDVETYLTGFQKDLGTVSSEIETLQLRSTAMNAKLENRQKVEKLLGPIVEQTIFPPALIRKLIDGNIDDNWTKALDELNDRLKSASKRPKAGQQAKGIDDLGPILDQLSDKAVERIRDHFVAQIKAIRAPLANAQIVQQQGFLRYKALFAFLATRQPQLAEELCQAYINTMRWYYSSHFTRYEASLLKLNILPTTRYDVIGEDANPSSKPATTTAKANALRAQDPFNLSRRGDIITRPLHTALPAHAAEATTAPQNIETPFLSFNLALLDNASFEYTFLTTFFPFTHHALSSHHAQIFAPLYTLGQTLTRTLTSDTYDALGVLICLRLTSRLAFTLQRRKVPVLEGYVNATNMLLWPRFQQILDAHCDSLRRLTASLPSRAAGIGAAASAFASLAGSAPAGAAAQSTAPHPVTQRFANLLASILALSASTAAANADALDAADGVGDDGPVAASVSRLRTDFEAFLARAAAGFGAGEKVRRERERFLANNYSLVLTVIADARGRLAVEQREHFEALRGVLEGRGQVR